MSTLDIGYRKRKKISISQIIIVIIMTLVVFVTLYPFIYVLSMSISNPLAVVRREVYLFPKGFSLASYKLVLEQKDIAIAFYNTVWYTAVGTLINIILTCMAAYSLSRPQFFLRRQIMFLMTMTMFINGGLIPLYIVVCKLGLYNTRWAIVLPAAINTYNLIIARSYFETIPNSLIESAKIDGANDWVILLRIVMPLAKPIIAVLLLFYGVWHWNEYFAPLIYLPNQNLQPIQLYLRSLLITNEMSTATQGANVGIDRLLMNEVLKYSTIVVSIFPITVLYPFVQKYFVKGVMIGAVKE